MRYSVLRVNRNMDAIDQIKTKTNKHIFSASFLRNTKNAIQIVAAATEI